MSIPVVQFTMLYYHVPGIYEHSAGVFYGCVLYVVQAAIYVGFFHFIGDCTFRARVYLHLVHLRANNPVLLVRSNIVSFMLGVAPLPLVACAIMWKSALPIFSGVIELALLLSAYIAISYEKRQWQRLLDVYFLHET